MSRSGAVPVHFTLPVMETPPGAPAEAAHDKHHICGPKMENFNAAQLANEIAKMCTQFSRRYQLEAQQRQFSSMSSLHKTESGDLHPAPSRCSISSVPPSPEKRPLEQLRQSSEPNVHDLGPAVTVEPRKAQMPAVATESFKADPENRQGVTSHVLPQSHEKVSHHDVEVVEANSNLTLGVISQPSGTLDDVLSSPFEMHSHWVSCWSPASEGISRLVRNHTSNASMGSGFFTDLAITSDDKWSRFVIYPSSKVSTLWSFLSAVALLYDVVAVPFKQGFDIDAEDFPILDVSDWLTRIFWTLDIGFNFFLGYFEHGEVVRNLRKTALQYFKGWFILDFLIVGLDWVFLFVGPGGGAARLPRLMKFARMARFMRMFRLLKVMRMSSMISLIIHYVFSEVGMARLVVMKMLFLIIVCNHTIACIWYGIGDRDAQPNWLDVYKVRGTSLTYRYSQSFIWALTQMGVGNSFVTSTNEGEAVYSIFVMIFSLVTMSTCISAFTNSLANIKQQRSAQNAQFHQLHEFYRNHQISGDLALRINKYISFKDESIEKRVMVSDVQLLRLVSQPLQAEVYYSVYKGCFQEASLFRQLCRWSRHLMRQVAHTATSTLLLSKGDHVYHRGQVASQTACLMQGELKYSMNLRHYSKSMGWRICLGEPAKWYCEAGLWVPWVHLASLYARSDSELASVDVRTFGSLTSSHPDVSSRVVRYASDFVEGLNSDIFCDGTASPDLHYAQQYDLSFGNMF